MLGATKWKFLRQQRRAGRLRCWAICGRHCPQHSDPARQRFCQWSGGLSYPPPQPGSAWLTWWWLDHFLFHSLFLISTSRCLGLFSALGHIGRKVALLPGFYCCLSALPSAPYLNSTLLGVAQPYGVLSGKIILFCRAVFRLGVLWASLCSGPRLGGVLCPLLLLLSVFCLGPRLALVRWAGRFVRPLAPAPGGSWWPRLGLLGLLAALLGCGRPGWGCPLWSAARFLPRARCGAGRFLSPPLFVLRGFSPSLFLALWPRVAFSLGRPAGLGLRPGCRRPCFPFSLLRFSLGVSRVSFVWCRWVLWLSPVAGVCRQPRRFRRRRHCSGWWVCFCGLRGWG